MRRKVISGFFGLIDKKQRNFNKQLEVRLDSIAYEVGELNRSISKRAHDLQAPESRHEQGTSIPEGMLERIANAYGIECKTTALLIYCIETSKHSWHTIDELAIRSGLSAGAIHEVTSRVQSPISQGLNKFGNMVYGLRGSVLGFLTEPRYF